MDGRLDDADDDAVGDGVGGSGGKIPRWISSSRWARIDIFLSSAADIKKIMLKKSRPDHCM